jgi:hypothetical protein
MATLTGQSIASSYEQLLHVDTDGGGTGTTLVPIKDGDNGTLFATQISTTTLCIDNPVTSSASQGGILRLQSDDGAVMASGHRLGVIEFGGAEDTSSTITTGARIEALTDATWSASENGADLAFYTTDGNASQTEALRITAEGYIGIGTSTPYANVTVQGVTGGSAVMYLLNYDSDTSGENGAIRFGNRGVDGETASITSNADGATDAGNLNFNTEATGGAIATRMTIDSNSRISLSNNDNNSYNTVLGKLAFNAGSDNASDYNTIIGEDAAGTGTVNGAAYNTAVGYKALEDITSGDANVALGMYACSSMLTGLGNVAIGSYDGTTAGPMRLSTAASNCIAVGTGSLAAIATSDADGTIAIGYKSLNAITSGQSNVAIGYQAGLENAIGDCNTSIGYDSWKDSLASLQNDHNTFIGFQSGSGTWVTAASSGNTAIGSSTLKGAMNAADNNTAVGFQSGKNVTTADQNTLMGLSSGYNLTTGSSNTFLGAEAGYNAVDVDKAVLIGKNAGFAGNMTADADGTISIGYDAGRVLTDGQYNVHIGHQAGLENNGDSNVAIGYDAFKDTLASLQNDNNVAIGYNAMSGTWVTAASTHNIGIGSGSLAGAMNAANYNTAIGSDALKAVTTGDNNIAIGTVAGDALTTMGECIFIGNAAGGAVSTSTANGTIAIGYAALGGATIGLGNIAIGSSALGDANAAGLHRNTAIGYLAASNVGSQAATDNTIVGNSACLNLTSGSTNTAIGSLAMGLGVVTGSGNTGVGYQALYDLTGGANNVAIGQESASSITTAENNIVIGKNAFLTPTTEADDNVVIGFEAMNGAIGTNAIVDTVVIGSGACQGAITSAASGTVAIGKAALAAQTSGIGNIAIGYSALVAEVTGDYNTAIGYAALASQTGTDGESSNTAVGFAAGKFATTATGSTFIGKDAGLGITGTKLTGNNNTAVGWEAGLEFEGAAHSNTMIGARAGKTTEAGVENVCIGYQALAEDDTATNQIVIGNNLVGTADNAIHIGNDTSHIRCDFNTDQTWDASSDRRQKRDIESSELGLAFINDLNPVKYKHKSPSEFPKEWSAYNADDTTPMGGNDKYKYGFIAQEVKEVVDKYNAPDYNAWSVDPDGRQRISREAMIVTLVKAVQELSAQVEELKNK